MGIFTLTQIRADTDLYLIPNAVGCSTDLTPVGAVNNWQCVDDPVNAPDDDTSYNYSLSPTLKYDLYVLPNHTTEIGAINYVQIFARAESHSMAQHEDGIYKIIITDNNCVDIYKSNDINLTTSYSNYNNTWATNPRTSTTWTWNDIDNLQIGIECSSPTLLNQTETMVLYPNGDYGQCGSLRPDNTYDSDSTHNWMTQGITSPASEYYIFISHLPYLVDTWYCDHYLMENHTALGTEPINYINIRILARKQTTTDEDYKIKTLIATPGNPPHYGNEIVLTSTWTYATTQYTTDPDTGIAWTWSSINLLLCGVSMLVGDTNTRLTCDHTELFINYNVDINPEIRTTQCYAKVNYIPSDTICILNKPEKISVDHSMNVKMLNFWNGDREVYGLNRSGKSMVLTGSEYQSNTCNKECPCERVMCMRNMGKDGSKTTLSGLRSLFNGDFKIRSFGWKHISEKPECYEWILELEYED